MTPSGPTRFALSQTPAAPAVPGIRSGKPYAMYNPRLRASEEKKSTLAPRSASSAWRWIDVRFEYPEVKSSGSTTHPRSGCASFASTMTLSARRRLPPTSPGLGLRFKAATEWVFCGVSAIVSAISALATLGPNSPEITCAIATPLLRFAYFVPCNLAVYGSLRQGTKAGGVSPASHYILTSWRERSVGPRYDN